MRSKSSFRSKLRKRTASSLHKRKSSTGIRDYYLIQTQEITVFRVEAGKNYKGRICPPTWIEWKKGTPEEEQTFHHFGIDVYVHYGIGPDNGSIICIESMDKYFLKNTDFGLLEFLELNGVEHDIQDIFCPVCQERIRASKERNPDKKYIKDLSPGRSVLVYWINRKNEDIGPQLYAMAPSIDDEITTSTGELGEELFVEDVDDGYDVKFESKDVKNEKGDTIRKYSGVNVVRNPSPLHEDDDVMDAWIELMMDNPLPKMIKWVTPEYVSSIFLPGVGEETDREETEEGSRNTKRAEKEEDDDGQEPGSEDEEIKLEDLTYEDLEDASDSDLKEIARRTGEIKERYIKRMERDELLEELCEVLDLEPPKEREDEDEKEEVSSDRRKALDRVAEMKRKREATKRTRPSR